METVTCFHHHERETGRACSRCGRPACPDCLHDAPVGSHCWECLRAARPPVRQRLRRWNATAGAVVTRTIIAANVAVFLLTTTVAGARTQLALQGPAVESGEWYRLVTSGFVHYGLLHLGFNMVVLHQLGGMLEPALGRLRFVALYAVALLAGSAGALALSPDAFTAGASGAVFGLAGAAAVALRRRGVDVWQSGVGGLLAVNLVLTFVIPGISVGGHVGGLVGGALAALVLAR